MNLPPPPLAFHVHAQEVEIRGHTNSFDSRVVAPPPAPEAPQRAADEGELSLPVSSPEADGELRTPRAPQGTALEATRYLRAQDAGGSGDDANAKSFGSIAAFSAETQLLSPPSAASALWPPPPLSLDDGL